MQHADYLRFTIFNPLHFANSGKKRVFLRGVLARNLWLSCKIRVETGKKQKLHLTFTGVCESLEYSAYSE